MRAIQEIRLGSYGLNRITSEFGQVAYLNSNDSHSRSLLAVGCLDELVIRTSITGDPFEALRAFQGKHDDWLFGYLSYELKDFISHKLSSQNIDYQQWPLMKFFRPEVVLEWKGGSVWAHYHSDITSENRIKEIVVALESPEVEDLSDINPFVPNVSKEEYLRVVQQIQKEIQFGNIYELNYCIPFDASIAELNGYQLYGKLNRQTEAPFSIYFADNEHILMCGSPERYLRRQGGILTAQPIKGTARRASGDEDDELKNRLRTDPKERAENIMITDLVRNDLSRVASRNSVEVKELCGIYTFKTVHQMISTITAHLKPGLDGVDALRATFPMGSMTGAPKISAMGMIEQFEARQRGLYSGAFGYFEPNGDFDFNVVIRSLLYQKSSGKLSFQVGSAITHLSVPEREYEECLLKAEALFQATKATDYVA